MILSAESLNTLARVSAACGTSFGLTFALTPLVRALAVRYGFISKPVEDRWGKRVVARLGGVAMFTGFLTAILCWVPLTSVVVGLLVVTALSFGLGLVDDVRRLPPYTKLVGQLVIGCVALVSGVRIELIHWPLAAIPLTVLWFVLIMNAFNLLDNMDGLSAGVGAIGAGFCALHAALSGQWTIVMVAAVVGGTCLGFLAHNFPPAKIFMGDSGSHFVGLSLAYLSVMGTWRHSTELFSVLVGPVLLLAVPIFDTCFVVVQRLTHQRHPFDGGTDHVSHRLAILGLGTRQTVTVLYAISACLGALAILSVTLPLSWMLVIGLSVTSGLIVLGLYLARVEVYRLPLPDTSPSQLTRPVTLIETMLLHKRRLVEILVDFSIVGIVYVTAHLLRFEGAMSGDVQQLVMQSLPVILVIKVSCFTGCGLYRGVWRYLSLSDLISVFKAVTLGSLLSSLALLYLWRFSGYSRAVLVIDWLLTFLAVGGTRVAERLFDEWITAVAHQGTPVVILGAGDTGELVLRHLKYEAKPARQVIGFLDDDVRTHGNLIHGCVVLGGREKLPRVLERDYVREVLVAISDPPGELLQYVQQCCEPVGASWKVVTAGIMNVL